MNAQQKRKQFLLQMQGLDVPFLGSICYWNVRSVSITKDEFAKFLGECELPTKFAKEHNYRSAFIRALRELEVKRIIRKVSEDDRFLTFQFTAETLSSEGNRIGELEYTMETRVVVDKDRYYETKDFALALVSEMPGFKADAGVNKKVLELFNQEKVRYNSSDVTRYLQRIIEEEADLVTLRDQGNVYFVPAKFSPIVEKVKQLVEKISPSGDDIRFEALPIPAADAAKVTISRSVMDELGAVINGLAEEISKLDPGLTDKAKLEWMDSRLRKVKRLKERIEMYGDIVPDKKVEEFTKTAEDLTQQILNVRKLDLDII